ncbi:MAG: tRNA (adenosine(37)-N6)-dimethylallyltransferase MiaA [Candidatus Cloacimonas sp.]|nr:tRNA (adenosine(37)-N6)-dimethylallyltransferase MiaA [Candidatus Cloacimonadota bacterium]
MIPIIVIEGPTASGKSRLALDLAQRLETEIISADSRQIYCFMDIGTAKPTLSDQKSVKHHMIDIINPDEEFNAGAFVDRAKKIIKNLHTKDKIPLICGGTGFYIKALLEGLFDTDEIDIKARESIIQLEKEKGAEHLYQLLSNVDPESAKQIHPNDSYRVKRALEVCISTGKSIREHWSEQDRSTQLFNPYRIMIVEERETLYNRINKRVEQMVEEGLIDEIQSLFDKGYKISDPGMNSVGYKEFFPYLKNNAPFDECQSEAQKNTRNYAKRQLTWYRKVNFQKLFNFSSYEPNLLLAEMRNYFESTQNELL